MVMKFMNVSRVSKCLLKLSRHRSLHISLATNFEHTGTSSRLFSFSTEVMAKKVAVILAGCGVFDGTELHEASACLVHLSRGGADVTSFAPNIEQMHTIDHTTGNEMTDKRNVLVESGRISRGKVSDLAGLKAADFDAVVLPGGFGAAKNLCDFAVKNAECTVNADVEKVLKDFIAAKKPIGLCCISPVIVAKVIPGCEVTIGSDEGTSAAIKAMGGNHVTVPVSKCHIDQKHKIVTTGAFMCEGEGAKIHEIHDGIGTMIQEVLKLA